MKREYFLVGALLIAGALVATFIAYPYLPNLVPTHWNLRGQPDGYSARWTLFVFTPGIMAALMGLFALLPWLSPRHFEVDTFTSTYLYIMLVSLGMFVYMHGFTLWAALHGALNVRHGIVGAVCLLVAMLGNVMGKVRRNFYIGVRTPGTIANERVWNATHRFAAKTFVLAGLAGLVLTFAVGGIWVPFGVLLAGVLVPVVYSLVYYKRLERRGEV
jgi:uncharacterized membrane protein